MKHIFNEGQWSWYELDQSQIDGAVHHAGKYWSYKQWAENTKKNMTNNLQTDTNEKGKEAIWGSLVYYQDLQDKNDNRLFHFYLTKECLITDKLNLTLVAEVNKENIKKKMNQVDNPIEGFMILISDIMSHFLHNLDKFEVRLRELLWSIKEKNNINILDQTAKSRHELLIWQNLIIPVIEIKYGIEEIFGEELSASIYVKRTVKRLERAQMLVNEYDKELKAMVELENTVSAHRGNEIMKTLTVMTTLFTPVAAWGAVWGMNFKGMPELEWKYGYLFSWGVIGATTFVLYWYLKKKGWMGDILRGKKRNSFFK